MRLILLVLLAALMHAARSFTESGHLPTPGTALAFGYLVVSAMLAGRLFEHLKLPRLTGYLMMGMAVGPDGLALLDQPLVDGLVLINGVAIGLIALSAGIEVDIAGLRPMLRILTWISSLAVGGTILLLAGTCLLLRGWLPFLEQMPLPQSVLMALVLGVAMVAQSPAVVVALRNETASDGPVTRAVLAVVVLADLLVIVLFALTSAAAKAAFGDEGALSNALFTLAWKVFGSVAAGVISGSLIAAYVKGVGAGLELFILVMCVIVAEVGGRLELDPLLTLLVAGMIIRNFTRAHETVGRAIAASALPVYALFFAVAGARIHLSQIPSLALPLLVLWVVRCLGLVGGTWVAGIASGAAPPVGRYAGWGLLPQAGLALALAVLFSKLFPEYGPDAAALTTGLIALNELVGPVLFRWALARSGEVGAKGSAR